MYTDLTEPQLQKNLVCSHLLAYGIWEENKDKYDLLGDLLIVKIAEGIYAVRDGTMSSEEFLIYKGEIK